MLNAIYHRILRYLNIEFIKPLPMIISSNDLFVLLEINADAATTSEPMTLENITANVVAKYGDQPLKYFNEYKRLKVVHLKTGNVKDIKLAIDF